VEPLDVVVRGLGSAGEAQSACGVQGSAHPCGRGAIVASKMDLEWTVACVLRETTSWPPTSMRHRVRSRGGRAGKPAIETGRVQAAASFRNGRLSPVGNRAMASSVDSCGFILRRQGVRPARSGRGGLGAFAEESRWERGRGGRAVIAWRGMEFAGVSLA
jgi:hypothetical protein